MESTQFNADEQIAHHLRSATELRNSADEVAAFRTYGLPPEVAQILEDHTAGGADALHTFAEHHTTAAGAVRDMAQADEQSGAQLASI